MNREHAYDGDATPRSNRTPLPNVKIKEMSRTLVGTKEDKQYEESYGEEPKKKYGRL